VEFASWVAYSGVCDRGDHEERQVASLVDDDSNHNQHEHIFISCRECGHIIKGEPDADMLAEYGIRI